MEIVINIDEKLYKELKCNLTNPMFGTVIDEIVANGTPLPKGHGELIDKNVVLDMMNYGILEEYITMIKGIIPADKEAEE